jgi:hypothetical protein
MTQKSSAPPSGTPLIIKLPPKGAQYLMKLARLGGGKCKDEYEDYFLQRYHDMIDERGEAYARRWAYWHAGRAVFFTVWEWIKLIKLILTIYFKLAGR